MRTARGSSGPGLCALMRHVRFMGPGEPGVEVSTSVVVAEGRGRKGQLPRPAFQLHQRRERCPWQEGPHSLCHPLPVP